MGEYEKEKYTKLIMETLDWEGDTRTHASYYRESINMLKEGFARHGIPLNDTQAYALLWNCIKSMLDEIHDIPGFFAHARVEDIFDVLKPVIRRKLKMIDE